MGELIVPHTDPRVVCVSCGRGMDRPGTDVCEVPAWHQPQPEVPDADVTAEDGDDLAPMTEEDVLAAVGPEPGKTWAELYAKAALQLSYRTAELAGAQRELDRLRGGGRLLIDVDRNAAPVVAALVRRLRNSDAEVRLTELELVAPARLRSWVEPASGDVVLVVES